MSTPFPAPRRIQLTSSGITLSVADAGSGPTVMLCHGFPDLAYGWRAQVQPLVDAGFRVVVPEGRGYGDSDAPTAVDAYGMGQLTDDLIGLLDALDVDRAVLVGHDWGGWVVWGAAVLHPERVAGVAGVCTPYLPFPSIARHLEATGGDPDRQYVAWFQEDGVAESVMDGQVEAIIRAVFRTGAPLEEVAAAAFADGAVDMNPFARPEKFADVGEPLADEAVLRRYIETFERTGFRGGINWYRNVDRNAADHPAVGNVALDLPALMVTAELDPALTPQMAEGMHERCRDLEVHQIAGAGHWVHQERPEAFNDVLIDWLRRRFGDAGRASG